MSLSDALKRYQHALSVLEETQEKMLCQQALDTLAARDAVQHWLTETSDISGAQLLLLEELDDRFRNLHVHINKTLQLKRWRSILNPPQNATWWYPPPPPALSPWLERRYPWLERFDWFWTFVSLFFLTLAVTVVLDTLNRVVGEGFNPQGMFPIVLQVLLTIAGGSTVLTQKGRDFLRTNLTRLRIPQHWWPEFSVIAALFVLLIVTGIHERYLPRLAAERHHVANTQREEGKFDSALRAYHQSLALQPDFAENHYGLGLIYEDLQRTDEAIIEYEFLIRRDPNTVDKLTWLRAHNNLGRLYILNKQYSTSWVLLERASDAITTDELDNKDIQAAHYSLLKNLGWVWFERGQLTEAMEYLNQAIKANPNRATAYCLKAQVLEEQEEDARDAWKSCLTKQRRIQPEEEEWAALARERLGKP